MRIALMTSLALPLAAAMTSDETAVQHKPEMISWGTEKNLLFILADVTDGGNMGSLPSYCTMPPPNPTCYRNDYPACCTDPDEECPDERPPCECDGDCVPCTYDNVSLSDGDEECGDDEFCMVSTGQCRLRVGTLAGTCASKGPRACTYESDPVCGCNGVTYPNPCAAQSAGANVMHTGECRNDNRRPAMPGSSYCTWSPDKDCYVDGWPQCCGEDGQECPPNQPRCDNHSTTGWDYCTWSPDESCYESGWPKCCERFDGTNCPTDQPNCDVTPTENSEDAVEVKFLRNGR